MIAAATLALLMSSPTGLSVPYRWKNVAIVGGGFVTGVIPHPTAKDVVYSRTDIGGAYRLDPKTRKWIPLQDWLTRSQWNWYGVESVGLDPSDPKRVYLAVGTYTNHWAGNGAILRSQDQGRTWKTTELPFKNGGNEDGRSIGERLAVDPADGNVIFFGTRHAGLWRSADAGATWAKVDSFPVLPAGKGGIGWVLFEGQSGSGPSQRILAAPAVLGQPLLRSQDGGKTWAPVFGSPKGIPHQGKLAQDGTLYVTYGNALGPNGVSDGSVWKLSPAGEWTDITPLKPTPEKGFGYAGLSLDASAPGTLIVSTLCRWGADTVFRSRDYGRTWVSLAETSTRDVSKSPYLKWGREEADFGHWIGDCEIDPHNPDRAWYVTGATIYETAGLREADQGRPTKWFVGAEGIEENAVIDIASPPTGVPVVSGLGDIGGFAHEDFDRSPSGGMVLSPLLSNVDSLDFAEGNPNLWVRVGRSYGGTQHGSYSLDGAKTWTALSTDPPGSTSGSGSAAISADGKTILWSTPQAPPSRTLDQGKTWEVCAGLPQGVRVLSDRVEPTTFYAHGPQGKVLVSRNSGKSFVDAGALPPGEVRRVKAVFGKESHLWAPSESGLFRSTDGGKAFVKVEGLTSAESVSFGKPARNSTYPTVFVIGRLGRQEGVYRSTDTGRTWQRISDESSGFGTMMHICGDRRVFGRVYIGTNGRGLLVADPK